MMRAAVVVALLAVAAPAAAQSIAVRRTSVPSDPVLRPFEVVLETRGAFDTVAVVVRQVVDGTRLGPVFVWHADDERGGRWRAQVVPWVIGHGGNFHLYAEGTTAPPRWRRWFWSRPTEARTITTPPIAVRLAPVVEPVTPTLAGEE